MTKTIVSDIPIHDVQLNQSKNYDTQNNKLSFLHSSARIKIKLPTFSDI